MNRNLAGQTAREFAKELADRAGIKSSVFRRELDMEGPAVVAIQLRRETDIAGVLLLLRGPNLGSAGKVRSSIISSAKAEQVTGESLRDYKAFYLLENQQ